MAGTGTTIRDEQISALRLRCERGEITPAELKAVLSEHAVPFDRAVSVDWDRPAPPEPGDELLWVELLYVGALIGGGLVTLALISGS